MKIVRELVSIANQLDSIKKYAEADVLTKVAQSMIGRDKVEAEIRFLERKIKRFIEDLPEGPDGQKVGNERDARDYQRLKADLERLQRQLPEKPKPHPDTLIPFLNPGEGHKSFY